MPKNKTAERETGLNDKIKEGNETDRIIIFDTTLRDGEQAPGFHLYPDEKLDIARQLSRLGVDVIEAGFAISSPGDGLAIYRIAQQIGTEDGPVICSLARTVDKDIEAAAKALEPASKKRIHTFIATSDMHIDRKFRKSKEWVIKQAVKGVTKAKSYVDDVEFSCEDFGRTDMDYTVEVICAAISAGATTINLPDTVGWLTPGESYEKIGYVIGKVRECGLDAVFSVHNHNDFGMATATSIEAIRAGARQVEATINGIGERAGNTALEEIVAVLKEKQIGKCGVNTKLIGETSRLIGKYTGIIPQPNKAIVGRNAFAHEAGVHQDGMMKERKTYEIMDPADYGVESIITFGPRSGRNALRAKYISMGIEIDDNDFEAAADTFTKLADGVKETDDADVIRALHGGEEIPDFYGLVSHHPVTDKVYGAVVKVRVGKEVRTEYAEGNGQLDAAIHAIRQIIQDECNLEDFKVISEGPGSDATGYTRIEVSKNGWRVIGKSEHTDVITSSINAFIDGCNRIKYLEDYFGE